MESVHTCNEIYFEGFIISVNLTWTFFVPASDSPKFEPINNSAVLVRYDPIIQFYNLGKIELMEIKAKGHLIGKAHRFN